MEGESVTWGQVGPFSTQSSQYHSKKRNDSLWTKLELRSIFRPATTAHGCGLEQFVRSFTDSFESFEKVTSSFETSGGGEGVLNVAFRKIGILHYTYVKTSQKKPLVKIMVVRKWHWLV